jgi:hypothetical protein
MAPINRALYRLLSEPCFARRYQREFLVNLRLNIEQWPPERPHDAWPTLERPINKSGSWTHQPESGSWVHQIAKGRDNFGGIGLLVNGTSGALTRF